MGFRMRKSMKIAPGVRLNVSKSGVGASVGGKGARYSAHSSGRRTTTVGSGIVPGVYYQKSSKGGGSRSSGSGSQAAAQQAAPPSPKKPGMFAPKGEKELYKAIKAQDVKAIKSVGVYHKDFRLPSYSLAGLMLLTDEPTRPSSCSARPSRPAKTRPRTSSSPATCSRGSSSRSPRALPPNCRSTATPSGSRSPS